MAVADTEQISFLRAELPNEINPIYPLFLD